MENYSVILNLTQHQASEEQIKAGVIDLPEPYNIKLKELLTFNELPTCEEVQKRAVAIVDLVEKFLLDDLSPIKDEIKKIKTLNEEERIEEFKKFNLAFMIGGALFLMQPLIDELKCIGTPLFAFTKRVTEEIPQPDGSIKKITVFKHEGFVPAC